MTNDKAAPASGSIMVVGGGIAGLTTALEAAEVGYEVFLVEKNPYLGGRVAQLNQYFPQSYALRPAAWKSTSGGSRTTPESRCSRWPKWRKWTERRATTLSVSRSIPAM